MAFINPLVKKSDVLNPPKPTLSGLKRKFPDSNIPGSDSVLEKASKKQSLGRPRLCSQEKEAVHKTLYDFNGDAPLAKTVIAWDREEIQEAFQNSAILLLDLSTHESSCHANICLADCAQLTKKLVSPFRINLLQIKEGIRPKPQLSQTYYHVSCMEYILDLKALLKPQHFMMVHTAMESFKLPKQYIPNPCTTKSVVLEGWFAHEGSAYSAEDFDRWLSAYTTWYESRAVYGDYNCPHGWFEALSCQCPPEFGKPKPGRIFPAERTSWPLSDLLASICGREQLDNLPNSLYEVLDEMSIFRYDGLKKGKQIA